MILLNLFYEFFKIGLFAIGGGLATIPFLYNLSYKTNWFEISEISNMIAISESTPGPLGINMATYAGFFTNGIIGGIIATLGLITPSIIVIILISKFISKFHNNIVVKKTFFGIRIGVIALILNIGIDMIKETLLNNNLSLKLFEMLLFISFLILLQKTKIHPIFLILISGIIGGLFYL